MPNNKLLVITDERSDGSALSPYQNTLFDNVLEYADSIMGRWDCTFEATEHPIKVIKDYPDHHVLLMGIHHAEVIRDYCDMDISKLKGAQLFGLLGKEGKRRIIATPHMREYGVGKVSPTRAALLGHLYRHIEMLHIGLIGWNNPMEKSNYRLVKNMRDWDELKQLLKTSKIVAIDTETISLLRIGNTILTIQFGFDGHTGWVLPIHHPESPLSDKNLEEIFSWLKWYFERAKKAIHVFANAPFDIHQLIDLLELQWYNHRIWDVQFGVFYLDENRIGRKAIGLGKGDIFGLERLGFEFGMDHYNRTTLGKADRSRLESKRLEYVAEYGGVDVVMPIRLMKMQIALAKWRSDHMHGRPYDRYVKNVLEVAGNKLLQFVFMERHGLRIDLDYMNSLSGNSGVFLKDIGESQARFNELSEVQEANKRLMKSSNIREGTLFGGKSVRKNYFDVGKQAHKFLLFDTIMKLEPVNRGKSDQPNYDKTFKEKYADNPVIKAFSDLVEARTLYNNNVKGWLKIMKKPDNKDGRIRTRFSSLRVVTDRSSSTDPNFQNVPQRKERAKIIKRAVITDPDKVFIKRDYSSHEVRTWGISAKDKAIALTYWTGMKVRLAYQGLREIPHNMKAKWEEKVKAADVHNQNYGLLYGVDPKSVTKPQRDGVKSTVFGALYGYAMSTLGRVLTKGIPKRVKEIYKRLDEINDALKKLRQS